MNIRWAICDDADYICTNLKMDLAEWKELQYVGKANTSSECLDLVEQTHPDILLLDVQMETETSGIDIIPQIKEISPKTKIIILTSFDDSEYIFIAFAHGAENYIVKTTTAKEIAAVIVSVFENKSMLPPKIAQKLAAKGKQIASSSRSLLYTAEIMSRLSASEYIVLKEIYAGHSYKEIAAICFVDVSTIRTHASRIIKKFGLLSMNEVIKSIEELNITEWF